MTTICVPPPHWPAKGMVYGHPLQYYAIVVMNTRCVLTAWEWSFAMYLIMYYKYFNLEFSFHSIEKKTVECGNHCWQILILILSDRSPPPYTGDSPLSFSKSPVGQSVIAFLVTDIFCLSCCFRVLV